MRRNHWIRRDPTAGGAIGEFALVMPVLMLLTIGAIDLGRAFYNSVTISNAAGTAAFYGAQDQFYAVKTESNGAIVQMARDDARDIGTVNAAAERICRCPDGTVVDCVTGACDGYGIPPMYVKCTVDKTFDTLVNLPKVPDLFTVRRTAYVRVR